MFAKVTAIRTSIRVAVAAAALLLPASVAAQAQPAQPDQATRDAARLHFTAGREALTAERFEEALTEFRAANELIPAAPALYNVGICLRKLHRDVEALEIFRGYLTTYANPTTDRDRQQRTEVENLVEEIQDTVGTVQVNVNVSGATVLVDGQVVGAAPLGHPVEVVAGPHTFRAEAEGYRPAEEAVRVEAGQQISVTLAPATLTTTATVNLSSNVPGAVATLDGETLGLLPFSGEVAAGVHQLMIRADGYETAQMPISLEAGQPFTRAVDLVASAEDGGGGEPWYEKWWVWTIAGVVVAGATAGIVLGTVSGETLPDSTWMLSLE